MSDESNVQCTRCGYLNESDAKFCLNCGYKLGENNLNKQKCPKCGYLNESDAKFCLNCGGKLNVDLSSTNINTDNTNLNSNEDNKNLHDWNSSMSKITIKEAVNSKSITFLNFYAQIKNNFFLVPRSNSFNSELEGVGVSIFILPRFNLWR